MEILKNIPEAEKQKDWFKLWKPIIEKRQKCKNFDRSPLFMTLSIDNGFRNWRTLKHLTEFALNNVQNSEKIFRSITTKIKIKSNDQDDIINEMITELTTIPVFRLLGATEILYQKENGVDFIVELNGETFGIEVSYKRGPSFKTQTRISEKSRIHKLGYEKLLKQLKNKYDEEAKQVLKYFPSGKNAIVFIVTDIEEAHPFWLEQLAVNGKHPIQHFIDSSEIPTLLLAPGLILYTSDKLKGILKTFDRNEYSQLAYGIDCTPMTIETECFIQDIRKNLGLDIVSG